jgi:hypothetical protein
MPKKAAYRDNPHFNLMKMCAKLLVAEAQDGQDSSPSFEGFP